MSVWDVVDAAHGIANTAAGLPWGSRDGIGVSSARAEGMYVGVGRCRGVNKVDSVAIGIECLLQGSMIVLP